MRSLAPDEAELWARVTATIKPLSRERVNPPRNGEGHEPRAAEEVRRPAPRPLQPRASRDGPAPRGGEELHRATLDGSWDRRLREGAIAPDRVVDLHGMSLDIAWRAIDAALEQALARGERVVLLITGHQRRGDPPVERGRIRAAVHAWLAASRHAPRIAAVRGAHRRHGGGGSLYLVLRRR